MLTENKTIDVSLLRAGNNPSNLSKTIDIPDTLEIWDNRKIPENFGVFRIMTPKDGDKRVVWDSRDFQQILDAKEMFNQLVANGLVPYKVGTNGRPSAEVMTEFDPHSEEVIFLPLGLVTGG